MKGKLLDGRHSEKDYALILEPGEEVIGMLEHFAVEHGIFASHFTAIGAFQRATLAYFDPQKQDYLDIPINEQVEVLSLVGDISSADGEPKVHAHVVVGKRDGTAHGGHIMEAYVWPTLEIMLEESPEHLRRKYDPETGLNLIDIEAAEISQS